jgi:hypothetical protein
MAAHYVGHQSLASAANARVALPAHEAQHNEALAALLPSTRSRVRRGTQRRSPRGPPGRRVELLAASLHASEPEQRARRLTTSDPPLPQIWDERASQTTFGRRPLGPSGDSRPAVATRARLRFEASARRVASRQSRLGAGGYATRVTPAAARSFCFPLARRGRCPRGRVRARAARAVLR